MTIKLLIFDFGGVILRTYDKTPRTKLAEKFGLTYEEIETLVFANHSGKKAALGLISTAGHWLEVSKELKFNQETIPQFQQDFFGGDRIDMQLVDLIRSLKCNYKTALLSNAWDNLRGFIVNNLAIDDIFDQMFISAELGLAKPDGKIYHRVLDEMRFSPEQCVFIDDFSENILAAQSLGMYAIQFHTREQVEEDLLTLLRDVD
jgi:epoxide hydrolase-like predicted phosphatase